MSSTAEERVRAGSRRKRDLAAVKAAAAARQRDNEDYWRADCRTSTAADLAWQSVRGRLADLLDESTFRMWLAPLKLAGETRGALLLEAPDGIVSWVQRCYGRMLGDTIRELSQFRGAFVARQLPEADPEADLL